LKTEATARGRGRGEYESRVGREQRGKAGEGGKGWGKETSNRKAEVAGIEGKLNPKP